jgi:hypothetical protein
LLLVGCVTAGCASQREDISMAALDLPAGMQDGSSATQREALTNGVEPRSSPQPTGGSSAVAARTDLREPSPVASALWSEPVAPREGSTRTGFSALSRPAQAWGEGEPPDYLVPVLDILGFEVLLNVFDRNFSSDDDYGSDFSSFEANLQSGWVIDEDPFATNQFLHPYQGSIYHGFARSAGHGYWTALGYDFAGSAIWELAGETVPPSLNDQITTTFGGSFLGEALFRMSSYLLERGGERPSAWRSTGAAMISPALGFNRLAYGERFDGVFPSQDPATYTRVGIGARRSESLSSDTDGPTDATELDFVMDYGLPGEPAYDYSRPFDYFHFEATLVSSADALPEDVMVRGLLVGSEYSLGQDYRGVCGLYGGFDYISPELFSVSSTSVSLGTTGQWWATDGLALQGTVLAGLGWTASGAIAEAQEDRNYHYGFSPQGLGALRILWSDIAVLDMTGRNYFIGVLDSSNSGDTESVLRGKLALTVRVWGLHALGIQYVASTRDAEFADIPDAHQSLGAFSVFYTLLSDTHFGAVDWH